MCSACNGSLLFEALPQYMTSHCVLRWIQRTSSPGTKPTSHWAASVLLGLRPCMLSPAEVLQPDGLVRNCGLVSALLLHSCIGAATAHSCWAPSQQELMDGQGSVSALQFCIL